MTSAELSGCGQARPVVDGRGTRCRSGRQSTHPVPRATCCSHAIDASQRIMREPPPSHAGPGPGCQPFKWLAEAFANAHGSASTSGSRQPTMHRQTSKAIELAAYRTAQEALTNIAKYASCSEVKIELSDAESVLTLEVSGQRSGHRRRGSWHKSKRLRSSAASESGPSAVGGWLDISSYGEPRHLHRSSPVPLAVCADRRHHWSRTNNDSKSFFATTTPWCAAASATRCARQLTSRSPPRSSKLRRSARAALRHARLRRAGAGHQPTGPRRVWKCSPACAESESTGARC